MPQTQEQIHASRARVRIVVSVAIGGLGDDGTYEATNSRDVEVEDEAQHVAKAAKALAAARLDQVVDSVVQSAIMAALTGKVTSGPL